MVFKLVVKRALMAEGAIHFDLGAVFHLFLVALETVLRVVAESAELEGAGQVGVEEFDCFLRHIGRYAGASFRTLGRFNFISRLLAPLCEGGMAEDAAGIGRGDGLGLFVLFFRFENRKL